MSYGTDTDTDLCWGDYFDAEVEANNTPEPAPVLTAEEVEANGYMIGRDSAYNVAEGRPPIPPIGRQGDQHYYMRPNPRAFLRGYGRGYNENIERFRVAVAEQRNSFNRYIQERTTRGLT